MASKIDEGVKAVLISIWVLAATLVIAACLVLFLMFMSRPAHSEEWINFGGVSKHSHGHYNEINPGLGYEFDVKGKEEDGVTVGAGAYRDSNRNAAAYAFLELKPIQPSPNLKFGAAWSLITGDNSSPFNTRAAVSPVAVWNINDVGFRFILWPALGSMNDRPTVFAIQFRVKVK